MSLYTDIPGIDIQVSREVVVASIQVDLDENVLARFQDDLLAAFTRRAHVASSSTSRASRRSTPKNSPRCAASSRWVTIMGAESVLVGMRPGVVSALIEVGADADGLRTAIDLDAAFALLEPEPKPSPTPTKTGADSADAQRSSGRRFAAGFRAETRLNVRDER